MCFFGAASYQLRGWWRKLLLQQASAPCYLVTQLVWDCLIDAVVGNSYPVDCLLAVVWAEGLHSSPFDYVYDSCILLGVHRGQHRLVW